MRKLALLLGLGLAGCAGTPGTLTQALEYTQQSLAAAQATALKSAQLYECKATVTYQVGTTFGAGGVPIAVPGGVVVSPGALNLSSTSGNTVTVEYDSPLCAAKGNKPGPNQQPVMVAH